MTEHLNQIGTDKDDTHAFISEGLHPYQKVPAVHYAEVDDSCGGLVARSEAALTEGLETAHGKGVLQFQSFENGPASNYGNWEGIEDDETICFMMYNYTTEDE